MRYRLPLLFLCVSLGCSHGSNRVSPFAHGDAWTNASTQSKTRDSAVRIEGPLRVKTDLLRTSPDGEKLYVQVDVGLKEPALFLVDTGASISAIQPMLAQSLGVEMRREKGLLEGLGGAVNWSSGELPPISIGKMKIHNVRAAIGVPGVPTTAGAMPLAGILGNNVWRQFVLSIDYKRNEMELTHPSVAEVPESAEPMVFDGYHCYAVVELEAGVGEETVRDAVMLELDTGSRGVLLSGATGKAFTHLATMGEEPIFGIGAGDNLPASAFLQQTYRIPLRSVTLGGRTVRGPQYAQLINYNTKHTVGPAEMPGLIGHGVFDGTRVVFDFPRRRFAIVDSPGEARPSDGHAILLQQDKKRYGNRADRGLYRARLLIWQEDLGGAQEALNGYVKKHPKNAAAQVLLARIRRTLGEMEAADEALAGLDPAQLVDQMELVGTVNALILSARPEEAHALAAAAITSRPHSSEPHIAMADVLLERGQLKEARAELLLANRLGENPDGNLLRRARLALHEEDRVGALAHLRRMVELYPSGGIALWFYTQVATQPEELQTLSADMDRAAARLHPEDVPHDFMLSAYTRIGDSQATKTLFDQGVVRDCDALEAVAAQSNCEAWYLAMANRDLDRALSLAQTATTEKPHRSDYLDTLAVVLWRRGEIQAAEKVAKKAALRSPSDIYLLWQLDRMASATPRVVSSPVE